MNNNIIAADLGNSRVKLLNDDNLISIEYNNNWIDKINQFIPDNSKIFYSSVNPKREEEIFRSEIISPSISFINSKILLEKEEFLKYKHINGIGPDRILGLIGALSITKPPIITIDCGTAITLNTVDNNYNLLGGVIFAGIYTQLNSLLNQAEEINNAYNKINEKEFIICDNDNPIGNNTDDALQKGIVNSVIAGIDKTLKNIISKYYKDENVKIYTTGGYGKQVSDCLKNSHKSIKHVQSLVLEGIIKLATNT